MENVGLITYELPLLLARPEQETDRFKRGYASVAAHEMAHQWFGDLVTMQWWNDTWLNEAFATWMSAKVVERAYPIWQTRLSGDERRFNAMQIDRLATTRQVRQPINTPDDLANAFDTITYSEGRRRPGDVRERRGRGALSQRRAALRLRACATATRRPRTSIAAIGAEAGTDQAATLAGLRSFVEQPGVPRLRSLLDCGLDGNGPPKLMLTQSRYVPSRPIGDPAFAQRWTFPACFQFGRGGDFNEFCTVIQDARTVVPLPAGESCPAWVLPNRGGNGYFVSTLTAELTQQLVRTPLLPSEAIPALDDAATLLGSGDWPVDLALDFAARFAPIARTRSPRRRSGWRARSAGDVARRRVRPRGLRALRAEEFRREGEAARLDRASADREGDAVLRQACCRGTPTSRRRRRPAARGAQLARDWVGSQGTVAGRRAVRARRPRRASRRARRARTCSTASSTGSAARQAPTATRCSPRSVRSAIRRWPKLPTTRCSRSGPRRATALTAMEAARGTTK